VSATVHPLPGAPGPHRHDWIDFLRWLVEDFRYAADDIVDVVEKPHYYREEYAAYLRDGGAER
jgi:hypothetical protein